MEGKAVDVQTPPENDIVQRLQQENAALRAELQALRSTAQLKASHSAPQHEHIFDFMKLPRELRNLIYEFCVVVGEVHIGDHHHWAQHPDMRYQRPKSAKAEVSLFTVNKQVRSEALEVYLLKNHFVVPSAAMWTSDGSSAGYARHIPGRPEHSIVRQNLRSISIPFDFRSVVEDDGGEVTINFHTEVDTDDEVNFAIQRHNDFAFSLYHNSIDTLARIPLDHQKLRKLQINLQNATCRLGCHRMVVVMFTDRDMKDQLGNWLFQADAHLIESLEFLGTINNQERRAVRLAFPHFLRSKITFRGQFDPGQGVWDPNIEILDETSNEDHARESPSE